MILYLLLLVFAILMTLIALGLTIGGLVKKKQTLWIGSLAAFVFFSLVTVFAAYTYVKQSIDYMGSVEFQEEVRKKGENMGKTWGNTVTGTAQGLESTLDDEAIAKLANKGAKIAGKGVKAIATGLDETTGKTTVFADESAEQAGITIGRAEEVNDSLNRTFGLFLDFKNDFDGKLLLTAYDSEGLKMDNSEITVSGKGGTGKIHLFRFSYLEPGLSGYCVLSKI